MNLRIDPTRAVNVLNQIALDQVLHPTLNGKPMRQGGATGRLNRHHLILANRAIELQQYVPSWLIEMSFGKSATRARRDATI